MKTIFNTAVLMTDQSMCDRMKQVCIDNDLPIWDYKYAFTYQKTEVNHLNFFDGDFFIAISLFESNVTSESEWLTLLQQHKKVNK